MEVYAFRGGKERVFAFTPDRTGANLPAQLGPWSLFKTLEIQRGDEAPRGAFNVDECFDDMERYGFHITEAHVRITESVVQA